MLGYQYNPGESSNEFLLRTCAITQALDAGDPEYVAFLPPWLANRSWSISVANELTGRFTHFVSTGDDSKIPSDLVTAIYTAVTACHSLCFISVLIFLSRR